jgi:hypothetical protein
MLVMKYGKKLKTEICDDKLSQIESKFDHFLNLEKQVCEKDNIIEGLICNS